MFPLPLFGVVFATLVQLLLLPSAILVANAVFILQWCMCPCTTHMHFCTRPYCTTQHGVVHPLLLGLAIVPAVDTQSPELAQVKRQSLQVCCVTLLVIGACKGP